MILWMARCYSEKDICDSTMKSQLHMNARSWLMHLFWLFKLFCDCCTMPWNNVIGQQIWKSMFTQCYERITLFLKVWKIVLKILWYAAVSSYKLLNLWKHWTVSKCAPMRTKAVLFRLLHLMFTCGLMDLTLIILIGSNVWSR